MEIKIPTPPTFSFRRTIISHGWCELLPFEIDRDKWLLTRVIDLGSTFPITVVLSSTGRAIKVTFSRNLNKRETARVERDVRHILRLDDDLGEFYALMSAEADFGWIGLQGAGRMLRSPTVFEDVVKMICTTNCSWALTLKMVTGIVQNLGPVTKEGRRGFPSAKAMADAPLSFYAETARAGYRAPYLKELADRVASGDLDVEGWLTSSLPTVDLQKQMKQIKGVGDYAAENLLKLVGRYDGLALDSWTRSKFFQLHNEGRKASDKKIARYYARFKEWRGLAFWCDMTRDWME